MPELFDLLCHAKCTIRAACAQVKSTICTYLPSEWPPHTQTLAQHNGQRWLAQIILKMFIKLQCTQTLDDLMMLMQLKYFCTDHAAAAAAVASSARFTVPDDEQYTSCLYYSRQFA